MKRKKREAELLQQLVSTSYDYLGLWAWNETVKRLQDKRQLLENADQMRTAGKSLAAVGMSLHAAPMGTNAARMFERNVDRAIDAAGFQSPHSPYLNRLGAPTCRNIRTYLRGRRNHLGFDETAYRTKSAFDLDYLSAKAEMAMVVAQPKLEALIMEVAVIYEPPPRDDSFDDDFVGVPEIFDLESRPESDSKNKLTLIGWALFQAERVGPYVTAVAAPRPKPAMQPSWSKSLEGADQLAYDVLAHQVWIASLQKMRDSGTSQRANRWQSVIAQQERLLLRSISGPSTIGEQLLHKATMGARRGSSSYIGWQPAQYDPELEAHAAELAAANRALFDALVDEPLLRSSVVKIDATANVSALAVLALGPVGLPPAITMGHQISL